MERKRECSVTAYCSAKKQRKRVVEDGGQGTEDSGVVVVVAGVGGCCEGAVLTQPSISWG